MNPLLAALLRRQVLFIGSIVLFAVFSLVNVLWFRPTAQRYQRAIKQATDLGMALDPDHNPRLMPPRLFALVGQNTRTAREAQEAVGSGTMTAEFLGELTQLMAARGVQVQSTEPAPVTQDQHSIQVRARLRVRCDYERFVALLDDIAQEQRLISIDRFTMTPDPSGQLAVDVWASRLVLKSGRP
jgi:hypothetical protein